MRILFTRFPLESAHGGAEVQTLSLMDGLNERGHAVAFLGSCPVLLRETTNLEIPHVELDIGKPPVTKSAALSFLWKKHAIQKKLEAALAGFSSLDVVVMLSLSEKLLMTDAAVKKGARVFWIEHDRVGPWLSKNPWLSALRKLSESVTTVCVSELSRKIYLGLGWDAEKVIVIPNGIDASRFIHAPHPDPLPPGERAAQLRIGCVARLSQEKGIDVLIHAVGRMPAMNLTIVGRGPDEGYLRQLIEHIHRTEMVDAERIRIVPQVIGLGDFYRSIDALVLPSRDNDPFGLVAAEAMTCGTPVIVTDQCGIAGYLQDGKDAVVVKADSADALRDGIERMADADFRKNIAVAGEKTAREQFSEELMVDHYEELFKKS